jgi:hypothetical protein
MRTKHAFKPTAFDHLESREVLSTMINVTQALNQVYNAYISNGGNVSLVSKQFPTIQFNGNSVEVVLNGKGAFSTLLANAKNTGMTVATSSATYDMVVGFIPIASLPKFANLPDTVSISPVATQPTLGVTVAHRLLMTPRLRL